MKADVAAKEIRKDLRQMLKEIDAPEGVTLSITTENRKRVIITLGGVSPSWLWELVQHGRHGIPDWEISEEAKAFHRAVLERAERYRTIVAELEGITIHDYALSVLWDYRITAPKEITV